MEANTLNTGEYHRSRSTAAEDTPLLTFSFSNEGGNRYEVSRTQSARE